jgi:hypothetical protein
MLGVMYVFEPDSNNVPPVEAEYHFIESPFKGVALTVTEPVPHLEPETLVGATGTELIIAETGVLLNETQFDTRVSA